MTKRIQVRLTVLALVLSLTAGCRPGGGDLRLPAIFGDHMVLQANVQAPVWGRSAPGSRVTVLGSWMPAALSSEAGAAGEWRVDLPTPGPGGPFTVSIRSGRAVVFRDVWIGEVWLCSGQSNMEMPLRGWTEFGQPVLESESAVADADRPSIRLFTVERQYSTAPMRDCRGQWRICTPQSAAEFSAVGYFFGRELSDRLNVPIGLIFSSWGGTPSEAWTGVETLREFGVFDERLDRLGDPEDYLKEIQARHRLDLAEWLKAAGPDNPRLPGRREGWKDPGLDERDWKKIEVPRLWAETELGDFMGAAWFRTWILLPEKWNGRELTVQLGPIDEMDTVWLNGVEIGRSLSPGEDYSIPRSYTASAGTARPGRNVLTVRVLNTHWFGGMYGQPEDLRIFPSGHPDDFLPLAGLWSYRREIQLDRLPEMPYLANPRIFQYPSVLFNAMIRPLAPFALRGVIWYQGESNTYDPALYEKIFSAMILDWRALWGEGDFPFYYVQIAPYLYGAGRDAPGLREAQRRCLRLPNTGMTVTLDIGSARTIHPPEKAEVGRRLALWALAGPYGRDLVFSGPLYRDFRVEGDRVRVRFDHCGSGLAARGEVLSQFEIAGEDGAFVPARAVIDGCTVMVSAPGMRRPKQVRYAWRSLTEASLFNREGLPASPFWAGRPGDPRFPDEFPPPDPSGRHDLGNSRLINGASDCSPPVNGVIRKR